MIHAVCPTIPRAHGTLATTLELRVHYALTPVPFLIPCASHGESQVKI